MTHQARHKLEDDAVLFNAAVRELGKIGYTGIDFDVGGKKSRRRYVLATSPEGQRQVIWIKTATHWPQQGDIVQFPWKKLTGSPDGERAVAVACEEAQGRGATHLLALSGNPVTALLSFAQLYPLNVVSQLVSQQAAATDSVFYRAHSSGLVVGAIDEGLKTAATLAATHGTNLLASETIPKGMPTPEARTHARQRYVRDPKVRAAVLELAEGRCECCKELGFLTAAGERYLETHHVVGVGERGPDVEGNVVALCPLCHRKAHFAADTIAIERRLVEVLRRRKRRAGEA